MPAQPLSAIGERVVLLSNQLVSRANNPSHVPILAAAVLIAEALGDVANAIREAGARE